MSRCQGLSTRLARLLRTIAVAALPIAALAGLRASTHTESRPTSPTTPSDRPDAIDGAPTRAVSINGADIAVTGEGATALLAHASEQAIKFGHLLPGSGDAAGFDLHAVPRPPGASRWLSFREHALDYHAVFYGGGVDSPRATLVWYRVELAARGWRILVAEGNPNAPDGAHLFATRGEALVLVLSEDGCQGTCTAIVGASTEVIERPLR